MTDNSHFAGCVLQYAGMVFAALVVLAAVVVLYAIRTGLWNQI